VLPNVIATHSDPEADLLRGELFSVEQLRRHAAAVARRHRLDPRHRPDRLLRRLAVNERVLIAGHQLVSQAAAGGRRVALAAEWLLDNFYLIEQQIALARRHLPPGYSRKLPQLASGPLAGYPRIYDMALELISHVDGRVDPETIAGFVASYQSVHPLDIGELWAFPIMLRLALLENLRRVVSRIARRRKDRDAAIAWAARLAETAEQAPQRLTQLLAELDAAHVPLTAAPFVEEFVSRLQAQGPAVAFVLAWVEQQLVDRGISVAQLLQLDGRTQGADRVSMGNSVSSLALVNGMNWKDFVESESAVERTLGGDPAGSYRAQDFATRDRCRKAVEEIAANGALNEQEVAAEAVRLAGAGGGSRETTEQRAHVGYFLIDAGRSVLERVAESRWNARRVFEHLSQGERLAVYLATIMLVMAPAAWFVFNAHGPRFAADRYAWLLAGSGLIAVSALAVSIVNLLVTWVVPPHALPRLDLSKGITSAHRTLVVVPTLLGNRAGILAMLEALEIRYLGNRDPDLFFALLTDFHDAEHAVEEGDDELFALARSGIAALNHKHGGSMQSVFFLFHRPRTWNPHERLFMGYERKRGKLEQLNAFLRGGAHEAFSEVIGDRSILPTIRYVITLDTDTQLPRDSARKLVGNLAHPLNRPPVRPQVRPRRLRVRDPPTAGVDQLGKRGTLTLCALGVGRAWNRSLHARGLGRLPRPLRRGFVRRQGNLRRGRVSRGSRRPIPGEPHSQPRPARKRLRAGGAGDRRRADRGAAGDGDRRGEPEAPLDPRGLADRVLGPSVRAGSERKVVQESADGALDLEDRRQPETLPRGAVALRTARGRLAAGNRADPVVHAARCLRHVPVDVARYRRGVHEQAGRARLAGARRRRPPFGRQAAGSSRPDAGPSPYEALVSVDAIVRSAVRMAFTRRGFSSGIRATTSAATPGPRCSRFTGRCGSARWSPSRWRSSWHRTGRWSLLSSRPSSAFGAWRPGSVTG
jgi:hypothetical protein